MTDRAATGARVILWAGVLAGLLPGAASALDTGHPGGLLFPEVLPNLALAVATVLLCIFGLYAYASLARFAPYHEWIYLYLASLTGIAWAAFLLVSGWPPAGAAFILITVSGLNLIVHVLRFDRVEISFPSRGEPEGVRAG